MFKRCYCGKRNLGDVRFSELRKQFPDPSLAAQIHVLRITPTRYESLDCFEH